MKLRILAGWMAVLGLPSALWAGGEVIAVVEDGVLLIEGDDEGNSVFVTETPAPGSGTFLVIGQDGTLVNGLASEVFSGGIVDVVLDLGPGEDLSEVAEADIPGDLVVLGGEDRNEFLLRDSTVGGDVSIENEDGGSESDFESSLIEGDIEICNDDGLDEVKLDGAVVEGDVLIDNGDGNEFGEGSVTDIEAETVVVGSLVVENGEGFDALDIGESEILGDVCVENGDGDADGAGSATDVEAFIGGDLTVVNEDGLDEVEIEESTIVGDVTIHNDGGGSAFELAAASIGGDLEIESRSGFDEVKLDDAEIGGDVEVTFKSGGSDFLTESSSGAGSVTIGGCLFVEGKGEYTDTFTLDVLDVDDDVEIHTGPGDDFITVLNSIVREDFIVDGASGTDTFTDGGGNTVLEESEITNIEVLLP